VSLPTVTVLLVEDEDTLRTAVAKILRKRGFLVIEAADGSTAIDALRNKRRDIDVILLDLTIPGADSHEVAEEAQWIRPATKIVITSAYSEEAGSDFLKLPQVVAYIRKPFQADELVRLLRETVLGSPAERDSRKTQRGIP
jgi:CheY-like chemotaxis protein